MRNCSKQRAALNRRVAPLRKAFLEEKTECAVCGHGATVVHEITPGVAARPKAIAERAAWLPLCYDCHSQIHSGMGKWPTSRQLALKLCCDPLHLDIEKINELRGRAPNAITLEDVVQWLRVV